MNPWSDITPSRTRKLDPLMNERSHPVWSSPAPGDPAIGSSMTSVVELGEGWRGIVACGATGVGPWRGFLERLLRDETSLPGYAVLKFADGRRVIRASLPEGSLEIACRYVRAEGVRGWLQRFRGSAARRDFDRTSALVRDGVGTARPWAYVDRGSPRRESWLVTEFLPDALDLDRLVLTHLPQLTGSQRRRVKSGWSEAVVGLFVALERCGWLHRDLKASNVLIVDAFGGSTSPRAVVVDLEGLKRRRPCRSGAYLRPIVRLAASLLDCPNLSRSDLVRFLCLYLERTGRSPKLWRRIFPEVVRKAKEYTRRTERRKTHKLDGFGAG